MIRRLPFFDHARLYERLGLRVFPVARLVSGSGGGLQCSCPRGAECSDPGKHPRLRGWRDQLSDIARWWGAGGGSNIGVETGKASGVVVIDVDPRHGGDENLLELEREHGPLPLTWRFLTGGGGEHVLFRHPGDYVACGANVLGSGVDVRGDGGFIVAPPSLHASGRRYAISVDHHPADVPLAAMPDWLHARLSGRRRHRQRRQRHERPVRPCAGLSRYGEVALDKACRRILDADDGEQELTINGASYGIGRLVGAGALPADFALRVLQFAVQQIDTHDSARPWRDLDRKVERSFTDGMGNPRKVLHR